SSGWLCVRAIRLCAQGIGKWWAIAQEFARSGSLRQWRRGRLAFGANGMGRRKMGRLRCYGAGRGVGLGARWLYCSVEKLDGGWPVRAVLGQGDGEWSALLYAWTRGGTGGGLSKLQRSEGA